MARIILTGEKQPIELPDEQAEVIMAQVSDPNFKGRITVPLPGGGSRSVAKHYVRDVQIGRGAAGGGYELDVDSTQGRAQAEELQGVLDKYAKSAEMKHELEWYGAPLEGHSESADARLRASGVVGNPVLGAAHWSTVQWALEQGLVSRREESYTPWHGPGAARPKPLTNIRWSILAVERGGQLDPSAFNRFDRVWKGVKELRSRRLYAARQAQAADEARLASLVAEAEEPAAESPTEPILPALAL